MKSPAFLFYSNDFISGVADLTMEERGQYITLLCLHHQKGRLSLDTINRSVRDLSKYVLEKFEQDETGLFFNKRLEIEANKRNSYVESRRNNAKKEESICSAYAKHMPMHMENINKDIISIEIQGTSNTGTKKVSQKKIKEKNPEKLLFSEAVYLTSEEYSKLLSQFGKIGTELKIQNLNDYILSRNAKYASHYHTVLSWSRKDTKDGKIIQLQALNCEIEKYNPSSSQPRPSVITDGVNILKLKWSEPLHSPSFLANSDLKGYRFPRPLEFDYALNLPDELYSIWLSFTGLDIKNQKYIPPQK